MILPLFRKLAAPLVCVAFVAAALLALPGQARAQEAMSVDIYGPGQSKVNIVLLPPRPVGQGAMTPMADELAQLMEKNISLLPFFDRTPLESLLGGDPSTGVKAAQIDFKPLALAKVDLVMTMGWENRGSGRKDLELRVFETFNSRLLIGKAYADVRKDRLQDVADRFCSLLMRHITGVGGFFRSRIAFVKKSGATKEIWTVDPMGRNLRQATSLGGLNLSPAWSWDRSMIAFTRIAGSGHELGIVDSATGNVQRKKFTGNTVISPAFTPNGRIAVTLALKKVPDIFLLSKSTFKPEPLVESWAIDVSPSFSADGRLMSFVSGRQGAPQIFLLNRDAGTSSRVTYEGKYNTHPRISPDGRLIVYSRQVRGGHRIFVHDLVSGIDRQVSFGPGSDEQPCFGPDGYFIAFASSRTGQKQLYFTTRHGDQPRLIRTGSGPATSPAWSTAEKD